MFQEILTYMIVGAAITLAVMKTFQKFRKKKKKTVNFKKDSFQLEHNCSECSAECMLRNASPKIIQDNKNICKQTKIIN
jgi:hypothetical protein